MSAKFSVALDGQEAEAGIVQAKGYEALRAVVEDVVPDVLYRAANEPRELLVRIVVHA